jgi:hypothetical protein
MTLHHVYREVLLLLLLIVSIIQSNGLLNVYYQG